MLIFSERHLVNLLALVFTSSAAYLTTHVFQTAQWCSMVESLLSRPPRILMLERSPMQLLSAMSTPWMIPKQDRSSSKQIGFSHVVAPFVGIQGNLFAFQYQFQIHDQVINDCYNVMVQIWINVCDHIYMFIDLLVCTLNQKKCIAN